MKVETVVVNPVTEQPLAVTVVKGEQVVVETMEPPVLNEVGTHCTVTCNAVFEDMHDDGEDNDGENDDGGDDDGDDDDELSKVLIDESEFELLSD